MRSTLVICLLLCLFLSGCSLWPKRSLQQDPRTKGEDQFDPLGFPQDENIVTQREPEKRSEGGAEVEDRNRMGLEGVQGTDDGFPVKGYRVQFFATKYPDEAASVAETVAKRLSEKTYIEYKAPYYWVKVGDCKTREESDSLLQKIKRLGYDESWVVEVKIEP